MHKFPEETPKKGQLVIAYCKSGSFYFARYTKALTWGGYKLKFVNINSNGLWHNDVIGWNNIPKETDTL